MDPKVIGVALVIVVVLAILLYIFVFKKSESTRPQRILPGKGQDSKKNVSVDFSIYKKPKYKGIIEEVDGELPEGEVIKIGNPKNEPAKSLKLGKNIVLKGKRVDDNELVTVKGPKNVKDAESGYYNIEIFIKRTQDVEGYRI